MLAGPHAAMMLGDLGARVIKVESPQGDDSRGWGPPFVGAEAAYFLGVNRNKRSLTLNMAAPAGQKILAGLVGKADVLIDNFRLGTLEKWGFTDDWFARHAPRLIRCSITGYGSNGPKSALPVALQGGGSSGGAADSLIEAPVHHARSRWQRDGCRSAACPRVR